MGNFNIQILKKIAKISTNQVQVKNNTKACIMYELQLTSELNWIKFVLVWQTVGPEQILLYKIHQFTFSVKIIFNYN